MAKTGPKPKPPEERFWTKVEKRPDGCWVWTGIKHQRGYGFFIVDTSRSTRTPGGAQKRTLAHRFAYELLVGPIPEGTEIDHLCRNPGCVNPAHLEAVTHRENVRRGDAPKIRRRTTCGRCGRPWSHYDKRGWGKCRHCYLTVYEPRARAKMKA